LIENNERYALQLESAGQIIMDVEVSNNNFRIDAQDIAAWRQDGIMEIAVTISQIGTYARSQPLILTLKI